MSGWFSGLGSALDELKQQAIKLSEVSGSRNREESESLSRG